MSVPAYAYAGSNPLRYADPSGLEIQVSIERNYSEAMSAPGTGPGTKVEGRPGTVPGIKGTWKPCVPDGGGKFKFDATLTAEINIYLNNDGSKRSVGDLNACTIAQHEDKHANDFTEDFKEINSRLKSEGFLSPKECQAALAKLEETLKNYVNIMSDRSAFLRDEVAR